MSKCRLTLYTHVERERQFPGGTFYHPYTHSLTRPNYPHVLVLIISEMRQDCVSSITFAHLASNLILYTRIYYIYLHKQLPNNYNTSLLHSYICKCSLIIALTSSAFGSICHPLLQSYLHIFLLEKSLRTQLMPN